ncbi:MAG: hypothetical protein FWD40_12160 [Treponema sp.]|nr:hypothetical protein [Treponema sp.]
MSFGFANHQAAKASIGSNLISNNGGQGYFFDIAALAGALTSSNQQFFLFPYLFYNVNSFFNAHGGFLIKSFNRKFNFFEYGINAGLLHVFNSNVKTEITYRRKILYGGGDFYEEINKDLSGIGMAFLSIKTGFHD